MGRPSFLRNEDTFYHRYSLWTLYLLLPISSEEAGTQLDPYQSYEVRQTINRLSIPLLNFSFPSSGLVGHYLELLQLVLHGLFSWGTLRPGVQSKDHLGDRTHFLENCLCFFLNSYDSKDKTLTSILHQDEYAQKWVVRLGLYSKEVVASIIISKPFLEREIQPGELGWAKA